uniref:Cilia- and flagella-associated protein 157 n=1 Tax=Caenorhabditis tropicalis TaxID=1561998 RepID=A0A1I7TXL2_9PELO
MRVSSQNEEDLSVERLAPVSLKGSQKINKIFHDLIDNWKKYTAQEDGDRIALMLQNYTVEKQLEHISEMQKEEIVDIVRFNLRKVTTLQEENEQLTRRNRDISEKLHRIENRVGKAQVEVFDKVQETTMEILKDFHARELDLARKVEALETEKTNLTSKNSKFEQKLEESERKISSLGAKNQRLTELNDENEKAVAEFSLKVQHHEDEIFQLREQLEKVNEVAREKTEEALQEAVESQRVKTLILKERETANLEAMRLQEKLIQEMDKYKSDLEKDLNIRHQRHKKEVEALNAKYESAVNHKDSLIQDLTERNHEAQAEIQKYRRNFQMMEAQIKGNMKRSLALNYQEMLAIISSGTSRLPSPPSELYRELEKENLRRHHTDRSPSPKRSLGVQTSDVPRVPSRAPSAPPSARTRESKKPMAPKFSSSVASARFPSARK